MKAAKILLGVSGVVVGMGLMTGCGGASRSAGGAPSVPSSYGGGGGNYGPTVDMESPSTASKSSDSSYSQPSYPSGGASAPPPAPPPAGAVAEASPPPAATALPRSTPEPVPHDRPGLGTEWGEARESHITEVSFLRAEPYRPFATASLWYNDWQGVQALAAYHGGPRFHSIPEANGAIVVSLRNASGDPLDAMHVGDRTYVIGEEGTRYTIVIENHSPRTFEAVATVDGLDVMNGKPGSFENRGYIVMPWATLEIDGFRQSEDAVAAFRFSRVRDSYAAQRGEARNVGVIGVAFFAKRGEEWDGSDLWQRDTASPFPRDPRFAPPPR